MERDLFVDDVQLYISDNCSNENIEEICSFYFRRGLNLEYHRNTTNLGMDGNFVNCFRNSKGKYTLILGSDDTPVPGFTGNLLNAIDGKDIGLLHLEQSGTSKNKLSMFYNINDFLIAINLGITYISENIVNTRFVNDVDLDIYKGTFFTQVPVYLEAATHSKMNMICVGSFYQGEDDSRNNGGYNYFEVFVVNLLNIYREYVARNLITLDAYYIVKKLIFKNQIAQYVVQLLILRKKRRFKTDNGWKILYRYYGHNYYSYYYVMVKLFSRIKLFVMRIAKEVLCVR